MLNRHSSDYEANHPSLHLSLDIWISCGSRVEFTGRNTELLFRVRILYFRLVAINASLPDHLFGSNLNHSNIHVYIFIHPRNVVNPHWLPMRIRICLGFTCIWYWIQLLSRYGPGT